MAVPTDITAGTITLTNGSKAFTGLGTGWVASDIRKGDLIVFIEGAETWNSPIIADITSNTTGLLEEDWAGPTLANVRYRIRYQWDSSRVSAQSRQLIDQLENGNIQSLSALSGPGVPVMDGPHTFTIRPESYFINGINYDVQVANLTERATYDGQSAGFSVLVSDVGDGRAALYSKKTNTSGDWTDAAYFTGSIGATPNVTASATTLSPGATATATTTPISGGVNIELGIPAGRSNGFPFLWSTQTTDVNPGSGVIRANNADLSSATFLYVSKFTSAASAISSFLLSINDSTSTSKGDVILQRLSDGATASYKVSSVTDAVNYVKIAVNSHSGSLALPPTGGNITFTFQRNGDKGIDGTGTFNGTASSTTDNIVVFADTTGKVAKDSGVKVINLVSQKNYNPGTPTVTPYIRIASLTGNDRSLTILLAGMGDFGTARRDHVILTLSSRVVSTGAYNLDVLALGPTNVQAPPVFYTRVISGTTVELWGRFSPYNNIINAITISNDYGGVINLDSWTTTIPSDITTTNVITRRVVTDVSLSILSATTAETLVGTVSKPLDVANTTSALTWQTLTDGTTVSINHNLGRRFTLTTSAARTITATNLKDGQQVIIVLTGNFNHTWDSAVFDFTEVGGMTTTVWPVYKVAGTVRAGKIRVYAVVESAA